MDRLGRRARFYRCTVCGAEVGLLRRGKPDFVPRCCNRDMVPLAA